MQGYVVYASRRSTSLAYISSINSIDLDRNGLVKDLGVWCDQRLTFVHDIDVTAASARRMLSFILRNCKSFDSRVALTDALYSALVRRRLEYATLV